jgi:nucleotide-binding universal stress UspA family protein
MTVNAQTAVRPRLQASPEEKDATMYQHLLVPVDGTELSDRLVHDSLKLATKLGAKVTAFVAEPMPPLPAMGSSPSIYQRDTDAHQARTEAHAREVLARFRAKAEEAGVPFDGKFQRTDSVDDGIVAAAKEFGCDLIMMITHGRGAFGELLFGSHTKNVMAHSKLPILVLH